MTAPFLPDDAEAKTTVQEAIEAFLAADSADAPTKPPSSSFRSKPATQRAIFI